MTMPGRSDGEWGHDAASCPHSPRPRRILLLGDICAKPGREAVIGSVPQLRQELGLDFVIANGENAAGGYGLTPDIVSEILACGVDCITTGDHFFDKKEIAKSLESEMRLLRPLNYPEGVPGRGSGVYTVSGVGGQGSGITDQGSGEGGWKIGVINLLGRVYLKPSDCPFQRVMPELQRIRQETNAIIIDFHAEATAEKISMGWYLDGEVSAVLGTHTHVPTADERILPRGTAYISDVGMCGGWDSVLGMRRDQAIRRMMLNIPLRLEPTRDNLRVCGVLVELDSESGRARTIQRIARGYVPPSPEEKAQASQGASEAGGQNHELRSPDPETPERPTASK